MLREFCRQIWILIRCVRRDNIKCPLSNTEAEQKLWHLSFAGICTKQKRTIIADQIDDEIDILFV